MRLSGSINYPGQKKIERGYRIELVTHAEPDDDRPPVPFEQFLVSFPKAARSASQGAAERPGRLQIGSDRITPSVLIARALEDDGQWHYSVRDLVAHWTNLNWSDAEIMLQAAGLTTPGYSVDQTRQELRSFIDSARSKWNLRDAEADVADALEEADATFPVMTIAEIENQPPPTYFIQDVVTDFGITLLYGDPGAGKTFLALDIASHIATGCDWNGHETKKGSVVYIVAEGGRGIGKRIKGWRQHHGIAAQDIDLLLIPEAVQILQDGQADKLARSITAHLSDGLGLLVVDTLSRSIAGIDENSADTMSSFLLSLDGIQKQLKCAVMVIHHSGKSKESGPRGSSAIAGGFDTVIHLKGKSGEQWSTMKVEKQKDDEEIPEKLFLKEQISLRHDGTGIEQGTTLILKERNSDEKKNDNDLTRDQIREIFGLITLGWVEDNPWSHSPQAKSRGRWLPLRISKTYGIDLESAKWWVASWMDNGVIKSERGRVQGQQIRGLVVNEEI
ncbi:MAG: helicase RepA family protein [Pseudomonadota bacterium]